MDFQVRVQPKVMGPLRKAAEFTYTPFRFSVVLGMLNAPGLRDISGRHASGDIRYTEADGSELPIRLNNLPGEFEGIDFWIGVVQTYERCSITRPEGRLIAVAGVAKSLQLLVNDKYLAGLCKDLQI
jgi:hypothetical protein